MKSKKFYIKTFGCQMNEYDSNKISELLNSISFKKIDKIDEADCLIFNTCHIRDKAYSKKYCISQINIQSKRNSIAKN